MTISTSELTHIPLKQAFLNDKPLSTDEVNTDIRSMTQNYKYPGTEDGYSSHPEVMLFAAK